MPLSVVIHCCPCDVASACRQPVAAPAGGHRERSAGRRAIRGNRAQWLAGRRKQGRRQQVNHGRCGARQPMGAPACRHSRGRMTHGGGSSCVVCRIVVKGACFSLPGTERQVCQCTRNACFIGVARLWHMRRPRSGPSGGVDRFRRCNASGRRRAWLCDKWQVGWGARRVIAQRRGSRQRCQGGRRRQMWPPNDRAAPRRCACRWGGRADGAS